MGSLPYVSHPRDDTKGACPLWKPPPNLRSLCSTVEAPPRAGGAGGESKEGAAAPSLVVVGVGFIWEGPYRKGPFPMRA